MTSNSTLPHPEILAAPGVAPTAPSPALSSAFSAVITLAAAPANVFRELADIENLPRWAGGFCERVELARGRWVALTALGELFLALDADERAGEITLRAGWSARALHALPLRVAAAREGGTRVTFTVPRVADEGHARLCHALGDEWPALAARCVGAVRSGAGL